MLDCIEDDQAGGTRRKIHTTFVILVLTEEELGLLAIVKALKEDPGEEHPYFLAVLEREPEADVLTQVWRAARLGLRLVYTSEQCVDNLSLRALCSSIFSLLQSSIFDQSVTMKRN